MSIPIAASSMPILVFGVVPSLVAIIAWLAFCLARDSSQRRRYLVIGGVGFVVPLRTTFDTLNH